MGAGKDEMANHLINKYGYIRLKLGKHIRKNVDRFCNALHIPPEENRKLLVTYAETCRVIFGADLWSAVVYDSIKNEKENNEYIIADGRQWHEYDYWVEQQDYIPIGIEADVELRKQRLIDRDGVDQSSQFDNMTEKQIGHIIEKIKKENGIVITNNGTLQQLQYQIDSMTRKLCK